MSLHRRMLELGVQRRQHEPDAIVIGDRDELGLDEVVVLAVQAVERRDDARLEEIAHVPLVMVARRAAGDVRRGNAHP